MNRFNLNVSRVHDSPDPSKYQSWVKLFCSICPCFLLVLFHCANSLFEGLVEFLWPTSFILFHLCFAQVNSIMYIYLIWAYMSRNYVYKSRYLICCIQGINAKLQFFPNNLPVIFILLICDANSFVGDNVHWWGIFQIGHILHQSATDVQPHCPSMDSFLIQCYSNETTRPMPVTHKCYLYEHVCPYPVSLCLWRWTCSLFRNLSRVYPCSFCIDLW